MPAHHSHICLEDGPHDFSPIWDIWGCVSHKLLGAEVTQAASLWATMEEEKWGNGLWQEMEVLVSLRIHGSYPPFLIPKPLFLSFHHSSLITYLKEKKPLSLDGPNPLYSLPPLPNPVKPGDEQNEGLPVCGYWCR